MTIMVTTTGMTRPRYSGTKEVFKALPGKERRSGHGLLQQSLLHARSQRILLEREKPLVYLHSWSPS